MASENSLNSGLNNGSLPDGSKHLAFTNVDLLSNVFCVIHMKANSKEVLSNFIRNMYSEITLLKLVKHHPRVDELMGS